MAFDPDAYLKSFEQKPTDEKTAPSFDPDEYLKGLDERLLEAQKPKKAEDVGIVEGTIAAFKRGMGDFGDIGSGLSLAKSAALDETDEARRKMLEIKQAQGQQDSLPQITTQDLQKIYEEKGLLSAAANVPKYITENIAQSLPTMATPLGAGQVAAKINPELGTLVGIGTYGVQQFGNFLVRQAQERDDPKELDLIKATIATGTTAPLGYFADKFTAGIGGLGTKKAGAEILKELSAREAAAQVGKRVATGAVEGIIAEAPVEVLEQAAERYQAGLSLTDESAMKEYREAFFGAAAVGATLGGASRGLSKPETGIETPPTEPVTTPPEGLTVPPEGVNTPIPGEPVTTPTEPINPPIDATATPLIPTGPQKVSPLVELAPGESVNPDLFQINKPYEQIAEEVTGMNVPQISNWAVENAPNDFAKYIAEKVSTRINDFEKIGLPMTLSVQHGADRKGRWYGMVQPRTGIEATGGTSSFEMNLRGLDKNGQADALTGTRYSTILHELIHVSSIAQLNRLGQQAKDGHVSPAFTELKGILNKVRAQVREDTKKADHHEAVKLINRGKEYTKDTDELIAYGFTDPVFQHYLSTVKMGNKSAFDKFVEIIQKLLGVKREYKSALEALVKASDTIYKPSAKEIQSEMNKKGFNFGKSQQTISAPIKKSAAIIEEAKTNKAPPVDSPAFKKWFGDSKVVDSNGNPLTMYHGTSKTEKGDAFTVFDTYGTNYGLFGLGAYFTDNPNVASSYTKKAGDQNPTVYPVYLSIQNPIDMDAKADRSLWESAFPDVDFNEFQPNVTKDKVIKKSDSNEGYYRAVEEYLTYDNYSKWEGAEAIQSGLMKMGFDGITHIGGGRVSDSGVNHKVFIAFHPEQIKSAIGNTGQYADNSADIRYESYQNETPQAQWHGPTESKIDSLIYKLQNKHIDTKRVIEAIEKTGKNIEDSWNVYLKEELYHGRTSSAIRKFLLQDILPTVKQMSRMGISPDDLKTYMHNLHAEERNAQIAKINPEMPDKGSGISTKDARDYLANLDPAKKAKLEEMAKKFQDMVKGTQQVLVDSGAETQDTVNAWNKTYQNYVPLFRVDDDFATHPSQAGTGQGLSSRGGFSKRAMGSEKGVQDILGNIIAQRERALIRAEKIRVGRAMYGLAIQNPNKDFWLPVNPDMIKDPASVARELDSLGLDGKDIVGLMMEPKNRYIYKDPRTGLETVALRVNPLERYKDSVFPVRVDGQDRFIFFNSNDPRANRMVEAMKNLDAEQLGTVEGLVAKATRWFSAVNTQYNPVFGGINLLRDIQGAMFNLSTTKIAGEQGKVTAGVFPAMRGIFATLRAERSGKALPNDEWAQLWADFKDQGGQTLYRDSLTRKAEEDQIIDQELKKLKSHNLKKAFGAAANMLSDFNDTIENSVRLSAYKAALDKGLSKEQAASIAKNLTVNFDRKGQLGSRLNALYAFFNASMQGSARLAETLLTRNDKGQYRLSKTGKKIVGGGILIGVAQAVAMAAAGFDEDEPPEFVKERNIIIPLPDKKYLMIPMPLGLHLLPNVGRVTTEFVLNGGKNPGKHVTNLMSTTMDAFNPIGGSGTALEMIAPSVLDPLVAIGTNKDAFGRPIYKEDRATNPTPGYLRSRESSSEISKAISKFLNYASGGTEFQKGMFSPTADEIDYLAGQVTGGAGREIMKTEQAIKAGITGEELPSYRIPLAGRFYGEGESQAADSQRFYQNVTRLAGHENEIKGLAKSKGNVAEYMRENPEAKLWQMANDSENQISALNKQKKDFIARNMPKERILAIDKQKQMVMKRLNDKVKSLQE